MNRDNVISDPQPLKPEYAPKNLIDRKEEKAVLTEAFSGITDYAGQNLYLHGPNGTGKTVLAEKTLSDLPSSTPSSYIDCKLHNTQYKALKNIYRTYRGKRNRSPYLRTTEEGRRQGLRSEHGYYLGRCRFPTSEGRRRTPLLPIADQGR